MQNSYKHKYEKYKKKYLECEKHHKVGYWIGPYGVRVPNNISMVRASDGFNLRYKSGGETEMGALNPPKMNAQIYRQKYAELRPDGCYYYIVDDSKKK